MTVEEAGAPAPCELEFDRPGDEPRVRTPPDGASEIPERPAREGDVDAGDLCRHTTSG